MNLANPSSGGSVNYFENSVNSKKFKFKKKGKKAEPPGSAGILPASGTAGILPAIPDLLRFWRSQNRPLDGDEILLAVLREKTVNAPNLLGRIVLDHLHNSLKIQVFQANIPFRFVFGKKHDPIAGNAKKAAFVLESGSFANSFFRDGTFFHLYSCVGNR